ncbi:putative zinc finger protein 833 [Ctenocephalides felis]|uniref:putative zinc finger protein 833 n=1 Tax=Ctenocephalides felis TaxID=7515 RepID=UPI000E6E4288|nr:putative zinc finger protein 833 [Ctenocephalides felis]
MSEETVSNKTIKTEPFDDYPQAKQEFDEYDNTPDLCMYNDDICLQQFLKSEVTIDEGIKQETIDDQDYLTNTNKTVLDENSYICDEEISNSSNLVDSTNKFEEVSGKSETTNKLKPFATKHNLNRHEIIHSGERPHECKICNKRFSRSSSLRQHSLIHTGERPHICELCNKKFNKKSNLNQHKLVHTGEQPYECKICYRRFSQSHSLKQHSLIHTGERPHECKICKKTFLQYGSLKYHLSVHTEERPHECKICNKRFTQINSLKLHSSVHSEERPYECETCNKTFKTKPVLIQHEKRIHTREPTVIKKSTKLLNQSKNCPT